MKTASLQAVFDQAIAGSPPHIQKLAKDLRGMIRGIHPEVFEVSWPRQGIVGFGVGPKKMSEHYCYISAHQSHANLGFYYGGRLPDPDHLLEGTGKLLRHVKVKTATQVSSPTLRELVRAALEERRRALHLSK